MCAYILIPPPTGTPFGKGRNIKCTKYFNRLYKYMNLFINSISNPCYLALFDNNRQIIATRELDIKGNESSKLIPELQSFIGNNKINQNDLDNIVVINGPGSFT